MDKYVYEVTLSTLVQGEKGDHTQTLYKDTIIAGTMLEALETAIDIKAERHRFAEKFSSIRLIGKVC